MKKISKCPACGAGIKKDAEVCEYCGTRFEDYKEESQETDSFAEGISQIASEIKEGLEETKQTFKSSSSSSSNSSSGVGGLWAAAIILCFIVPPVGFIMFFVALVRTISSR